MMPPSMLNVVNKKPWEINFVDTSELFSFGSWTNQKSLSLDLLTHSLGIQSPKSIMDGSQVSEFFYNGRISDIVTYCEADVRAVMEVVETVSV
jgi:predicted PolB exonuclease-like 3'-5' exonuclease